jgi:hypothetical protein
MLIRTCLAKLPLSQWDHVKVPQYTENCLLSPLVRTVVPEPHPDTLDTPCIVCRQQLTLAQPPVTSNIN